MDEIEWDPTLYKYEHIARVLGERIRAGALPAGTLLSEVAYESVFGVARHTVRQAFAILRDEGLIVTRRGKGSVVVARGDVLD